MISLLDTIMTWNFSNQTMPSSMQFNGWLSLVNFVRSLTFGLMCDSMTVVFMDLCVDASDRDPYLS